MMFSRKELKLVYGVTVCLLVLAVVSYAAIRRYGMSLTEIAHLLHVSVQSLIRAVKTGERVLQEKGRIVTGLVK